MSADMFSGLFTAGATLATSLMAARQEKYKRQQEARENEKDRQAEIYQQQQNLAYQREALAAQAAQEAAALENQKKLALSNLVSTQGKGSEEGLIRNMQAYADSPERTNEAVATLVGALRGGR